MKATISRSLNQPFTQPMVTVDNNGELVKTPMTRKATETAFSTFINLMPGLWNSQRTYHYNQPPNQRHESSQTTFEVGSLRPDAIDDVLQCNESATSNLERWQLDGTYGFQVSFRTKMQSSDELVISSTNLAFVPHSFHENGFIRGDYFRDLGYEERAPIKAQFVFDAAKSQLVMTTYYSQVVSVDSIALINSSTRLRQIVNYQRPRHGTSLSEIELVGFGLETRGSPEKRLVQ